MNQNPDDLRSLGIPPEFFGARQLSRSEEASHLVFVELGADGREHFLAPAAAQGWKTMQAAAKAEGLPLLIVSAFRSIDRQAQIIRRKLAQGLGLDEILQVSAPPGFSEHHTGLAIDIGTPESQALETAFAQTAAFAWLCRHAGESGFRMSYPENNPAGFLYEPWHWCFVAGSANAQDL